MVNVDSVSGPVPDSRARERPKGGICPVCGARIDHLINRQSGLMEFIATLDADGLMTYELKEMEADGDINEWLCPSCRSILATSEDGAVRVLGGEGYE